MSHIISSIYLFFDMREKVWKGISLVYREQGSRPNSWIYEKIHEKKKRIPQPQSEKKERVQQTTVQEEDY
jgi:hypothetical protein